MSRRPAVITQADVRRVIRAAKQEGASSIEVQPDGRIFIRLSSEESPAPLEKRLEVVL